MGTTNFSEMLLTISNIFIQENAFENDVRKMAFGLCLIVLMIKILHQIQIYVDIVEFI